MLTLSFFTSKTKSMTTYIILLKIRYHRQNEAINRVNHKNSRELFIKNTVNQLFCLAFCFKSVKNRQSRYPSTLGTYLTSSVHHTFLLRCSYARNATQHANKCSKNVKNKVTKCMHFLLSNNLNQKNCYNNFIPRPLNCIMNLKQSTRTK